MHSFRREVHLGDTTADCRGEGDAHLVRHLQEQEHGLCCAWRAAAAAGRRTAPRRLPFDRRRGARHAQSGRHVQEDVGAPLSGA